MGIEQGRISKWQAVFLVANSILASMILVAPSLLVQVAGEDAWITVLIAGVFGLLIGGLVVSLGLRFPQQNLVEYSIDLLGSWFGRAVCIIFALFFLYLNAYLVRTFSGLLVTETMPETPFVVFNILLIILVAYGVYQGLEVITRVNDIVFPLSILVLLGIFSMGIPEMDFEQLKPFLSHSFPNMLRASLILLAFYAEGAFLLMVIPTMSRPEEVKMVVGSVSVILFIVMLVDVVGLLALFGSNETARMAFPTFEFAKTVHLGGFLERIESLVVGIWVGSVGLKIMTFYYISVVTFAEVFNLQHYRPLVLPYAFILAVLSIIGWADTNQIRIYLSRYYPLFAITVMVGTTLLLHITGAGRKKGSKGGEEKDEGDISH